MYIVVTNDPEFRPIWTRSKRMFGRLMSSLRGLHPTTVWK